MLMMRMTIWISECDATSRFGDHLLLSAACSCILSRALSLPLLRNGSTVHSEVVSIGEVYILLDLWAPNWGPSDVHTLIDT